MKTLEKRKPSASSPKPAMVLPGEGAREEICIGAHIRHARLTKDLSLRQLADVVGCSESFVSKIENDKVRPSFSMLHRIVAALDINVAALFAERGAELGPVIIMRPNKRPVIHVDHIGRDNGITLERLIPHFSGTLLQANIHHINPGANTDGSIEHQGEEFGYVLEGRLRLIVNSVTYEVEHGESFSFPSHLAHSYSNPATVVTRVLWVNTPPTF